MLRSAAQPTSPSQALTRLGPFLSPLKGGEGLCSQPPAVSRQCRRLSRRRVYNRFPFPGQPCVIRERGDPAHRAGWVRVNTGNHPLDYDH